MKRVGIVLLGLAVVVGGWAFYQFVLTSDADVQSLQQAPVHGNLNEREKEIIQMLVERNKLIVSLATLIIGGTVGLLVTIMKDVSTSVPKSGWVTLAMSWLAFAVSLLSGYKHYEGLAVMLDYKFFAPLHTYFVKWAVVQFWSFIVGLVASVAFLLQIGLAVPRSHGGRP